MTDGAKETRRAYKREWAKNNPDKVREQQRRYWEKRAIEKREAPVNGPEKLNAAAD